MQKFILGFVLLVLSHAPGTYLFAQEDISKQLDAYWAELGRTVSEGDFEAYANGYHPDAVYVSSSKAESFPITNALAGWEQGFIDTREGRSRASVEFRFSARYHDATSAHETGIFRYTSQAEEGEENVVFVHFEALLVKKEHWLTVMEYQKSAASQEDWDELK